MSSSAYVGSKCGEKGDGKGGEPLLSKNGHGNGHVEKGQAIGKGKAYGKSKAWVEKGAGQIAEAAKGKSA